MVNVESFLGCFVVIFVAILSYVPLNNLLLRPDWMSLSFGPALQATLPVWLLILIILMCFLIVLVTSDNSEED